MKKQLVMEVDRLQTEISAYPKENLFINRNGKYVKYYISNGRHPVYVSKKDMDIVQKLALKKYKTLLLEEKKQELSTLTKFMKYYPNHKEKACELLEEQSPYYVLLKDQLKNLPEKIVAWKEEKYETNCKHPEHLLHKTLSGHFVRSKSEVIIANALFLNQIPYRYECLLTLAEIDLYPDFTILRPDEERVIYWEHFGLMDHPAYRENVYNKLKVYGNHNIIPNINLITTYETKEHPINSEEVYALIRKYFQIQ